MEERVSIPTPDGNCPAVVLRPDGKSGPLPAVIMYMDAFGIRPALVAMAQRLADAGYVVLLPDLFFRAGPYGPLDPKVLFADADLRGKTLPPLMGSSNNQVAAKDTAAFLAYLDSRGDVAGPRVGTTGYCMGGGMSLTAAATYPDRVVAAASFHGGNLANDSAMSPHLAVSKIKAEVYVAGADMDNSYPPEMAQRLEEALTAAGVTHRCEIYAGARHGWTMTDFPVYNAEAEQRHYRELTGLLARKLGA